MTAELPSSWSKSEICSGLKLSPRAIDRLIRDGKVSYYLAGRSKRFLAEHVAQIVAALEVKPEPKPLELSAQLGLSRQSAARRRKSA